MAFDRIVGFEEMHGRDDFKTTSLETRLFATGERACEINSGVCSGGGEEAAYTYQREEDDATEFAIALQNSWHISAPQLCVRLTVYDYLLGTRQTKVLAGMP